ncbi:hypothetical protein O5466_18795 [Escherichia coli]|nr:hypothetical protein [Escherichia coli]
MMPFLPRWETFLPEVNDGLEAVKPLLEEVRTFVRENPELVKTIAKIGLALLTVGAAAGSLSRIMKVLGGVMNMMTPAKGLIALLVGGAYLIIDNWETVGPVIKKSGTWWMKRRRRWGDGKLF